jgi:hypothetical protein
MTRREGGKKKGMREGVRQEVINECSDAGALP